MMIFNQETLYEIMDEIDPLLQLHYEELCLHRESIKLDPMWDEYSTLERMGRFIVYTAREDKKLVGYAAFFMMPHMHYAQTKLAINDVLFIHPEYRKNTCGFRFIQFVDNELSQRSDVDKIMWRVKFSLDWSNILHKLGYVDEEKALGKMTRK